MNIKMVFYTVGRVFELVALLMLLPFVVALIYGESNAAFSFLITILSSFATGVILTLITRTKNRVIYAKEGFAITALTWIVMATVGAVPFTLSGEIPSYVDAVFETVSGFTTTGSSILTDVESLSHAMLFWRSFSHWIGGMGVLVFVMAVIPNIADRSIHIMRAEMPGPVIGKLVPRVKDTAKILYLIYIVLTAVQVILLFAGGMSVFDSLLHTFGTAGTGGFGIKADSLASYSPYCQWVIGIFMIIFGVNFNLYYLILIRRFKAVFKSTELWAYLAVVAVSVTAISFNISSMYKSVEETVRTSLFQVASIISTTGYATTDFNLWPGLSKGILLLLMFTGACAGSTAGGLKMSRVVMLFKSVGREIRKMLHPRSVNAVQFEGKPADEATLNSVGTYFAVYMICLLGSFLLISFEPFGFESNFSAAVTCFNNIGPGFAVVGPTGSFAEYSDFSKIVLSAAMLFGRLEIFPLIIAFSPTTWRTKKKV